MITSNELTFHITIHKIVTYLHYTMEVLHRGEFKEEKSGNIKRRNLHGLFPDSRSDRPLWNSRKEEGKISVTIEVSLIRAVEYTMP